jgi:signal transduction histidine kinase
MTDLIQLLVVPPGSLAYQLVLATVAALILGVAQVFRDGHGAVPARRWRIAAATVLALQLALAGAGWLGRDDIAAHLPTLGRFASLAGILVTGWVILFPRPNRVVDIGLVMLTSAGILGLIATSLLPPSLDVVWDLSNLAAAVSICLALLVRRPGQWGVPLAAFGLLVLGGGAHVWGQWGMGQEGSTLGLARLGELSAYPLVALAAARSLATASQAVDASATPLPPRVEASTPTPSRVDIENMLRMISAATPARFAEEVVRAVAGVLRAEYCLILTPPDPQGRLTIAAAYDLIREKQHPGASFERDQTPILSASLAQMRTVALPGRSGSPDARFLRQALGLTATGPALLVPLSEGGEPLGGLLVLSPFARQDWLPEDRTRLESMAGPISARLAELRRSAASREGLTTGSADMPEERRLPASGEPEGQGQAFPGGDGADNLGALLAMQEDAQETIRRLEDELARLKATTGEAEAERPRDDRQRDSERVEREVDRLADELGETRRALAAERERSRTAGLAARSARGTNVEAIGLLVREIRQPATTLLEHTEMLLSESAGELTTTQRAFVERMRSAVDRIGTLLSDLTQVASLEAGMPGASGEAVDLLQCLEAAVMRSEADLRGKGQTLRLDFPDELPPVRGGQGAVIQILHHLLDNAIAASPDRGQVVFTAGIRPAEKSDDPGFVWLAVRDAGDGISPEDLGRVFQPRSHSGKAAPSGLGTDGLGLSVVKSLSESMGGRVWVDSVVGSGTTVTVLLPLDPPNPMWRGIGPA